MSDLEYYDGEFTNEFLDEQADIGEYLLLLNEEYIFLEISRNNPYGQPLDGFHAT